MIYPYLVEATRKSDLVRARYAMTMYENEGLLIDHEGMPQELREYEDIKPLELVQDNLPEVVATDFFESGDLDDLDYRHDEKLAIDRKAARQLRDLFLEKTRHYEKLLEYFDKNVEDEVLYEANKVLKQMASGSIELESLSQVVKAIKEGAELKWNR